MSFVYPTGYTLFIQSIVNAHSIAISDFLKLYSLVDSFPVFSSSSQPGNLTHLEKKG